MSGRSCALRGHKGDREEERQRESEETRKVLVEAWNGSTQIVSLSSLGGLPEISTLP
jgi:hypothetical protein